MCIQANGEIILMLIDTCRVLFGSNHLFVFHHPRDADLIKKDKSAEEKKPTFEEAQKEIAEQSGLNDLLGIDPTKSKGKRIKIMKIDLSFLQQKCMVNVQCCIFQTTYFYRKI